MNWKIVSGREDTVDTGQGFITCNTGSRARSDARLVKAAPDLLEALNELVKACNPRPGHGVTLMDDDPPLAKARAAITKAETAAAPAKG
jgi:hypothetical protein